MAKKVKIAERWNLLEGSDSRLDAVLHDLIDENIDFVLTHLHEGADLDSVRNAAFVVLDYLRNHPEP